MLRSRLLMVDGGWEAYDGNSDGAWTQVATGSGYEIGGLCGFPNAFSTPSSGEPSAGVVHFDPYNHNSGINIVYAQKFTVLGRTIAALGSTRSLSTSGNIYATDIAVINSGFILATHGSWQAPSYATGWTHDGTGILAGAAGGSTSGNGNCGTIRPLDSTRALYCADGTTWGKGVAVQSFSGTTMGSMGSTYSLTGYVAGNALCTAVPYTASHSLAMYSDSGTLKLQGLQHASTTVSQLVAPISVQASFDGSSAVMSDPLDAFGSEPNRFCLMWYNGTSIKACLVGINGSTITLGTAITLNASGNWFWPQHNKLLVLGSGCIMAVSNDGHIFPLYFNSSNSSDLTLTPSPRATANGAFQVPLTSGPSSGIAAATLTPNRFLLAGATSTGVAVKVVSNGRS